MISPHRRERMRLYEQEKPRPTKGLPLTTPVKPLEQVLGRSEHECPYHSQVKRHPIVLDMTLELGTEPSTKLG